MAIKIECGECGKEYSVKDEFAGKKIRGKVCQTPIKVPADDEWDDEIEEVEFQPPVRKSAKKKSRRRSNPNDKPISIRIGVVCLVGIICMTLADLALCVYILADPHNPKEIAIASIIRDLFAGLIQVRVMMGILGRNASTRWTSLFIAAVVSLIIGWALASGVFSRPELEGVRKLMAFALGIRVLYIISMLFPSSGDYLNQ